ncbi:unnamed protein product [Blepharisma stoltei]|uniref:Uncharacterized protein n=1 Tax=Blepharisma stoltei TaxID=1481888 RepID=A0AAU9JTA7_9CILI|nr:unnamed protein product [Blepharisma stoltei]
MIKLLLLAFLAKIIALLVMYILECALPAKTILQWRKTQKTLKHVGANHLWLGTELFASVQTLDKNGLELIV